MITRRTVESAGPDASRQSASGVEACPREDEVLRAVLAGAWLDGSDDALRDHVSACTSCASLVKVTSALRAERDAMRASVRIPAAGTVFWRAELRARQDAARAAARPVPVTVAVGLAAVAGLALALLVPGASWLMAWVVWLRELGPSVTLPSPLAFTLPASLIAAIALGACLIIAPIAVYLAARDD